MIELFVMAWDAYKNNLSEYIASHRQEEYNSYEKIVKMLFEQVINPYMKIHHSNLFELEMLHEIDDGDHSGTLLYIIPQQGRLNEPEPWEYVITYVYYGSCSGCDALMHISNYDDDLPDAEQVEEYTKLCLDILQHCKYPFRYGVD